MKKRSQNIKEGVILNLFQDLIRVVAVLWRFRHEAKPTDSCLRRGRLVNKFGMTQRGVEIVSKPFLVLLLVGLMACNGEDAVPEQPTFTQTPPGFTLDRSDSSASTIHFIDITQELELK